MGPSLWQLLIVLLIVLLIFGTKRLRTLGSDLGNAIRGFREALSGDEKASEEQEKPSGELAQGETSAEDQEKVSPSPKREEL